jgi:TetR/AcrR family transcriptional regulator, regulator of autoinduction and epiphytic fitness
VPDKTKTKNNVVSLRPGPSPAPARKPFRQVQFEMREQAILDATTTLLASKGYEQMAMDDIALEVGIAKGSLYKHFDSKDALAAAVMLRLIKRTREFLAELPRVGPAIKNLRALLGWTLLERLTGQVPHLPSTSPALQNSLVSNKNYMAELMALSDEIGELIVSAKSAGQIPAHLADETVLFSLYARSCDPTLDFLKASGRMTDAQIVEQMLSSCMHGLQAP